MIIKHWVICCTNKQWYRRCKGHNQWLSIRQVSKFSTLRHNNIITTKSWVISKSSDLTTPCNSCPLTRTNNSSRSYLYLFLSYKHPRIKLWYPKSPQHPRSPNLRTISWLISSRPKVQVHSSTISLNNSSIHRCTRHQPTLKCNIPITSNSNNTSCNNSSPQLWLT